MNRIVRISDALASNEIQDVLLTRSLGSCIGVSLYDAVMRVGGLLHFQLPSSAANVVRAGENPLMYADTGMQWLIAEMESLGAERRRLRVALAGGAKMLNDDNVFNIGRRNHASIRKILWQCGLFITWEEVGGTIPRNMALSIADGTVTVSSHKGQIALSA